MEQINLFGLPGNVPEGFRYVPDLITKEEEQALIREFEQLPLVPYVHEGFEAKRRIAFFGLHHHGDDALNLREDVPIPEYLLPLRENAAGFANLKPEELVHALVTEYQPGTPIGWHRDMPPFDKIVGVSFAAPCQFRMRMELNGAVEGKTGTKTKWERYSLTAEPRSAYIMEGPARYVWQHSIPPLEQLRYSVTFRTIQQ